MGQKILLAASERRYEINEIAVKKPIGKLQLQCHAHACCFHDENSVFGTFHAGSYPM
ncbi:hypothetical protein [Stenotrophomonas terrae]|uniref:hypothetical protein n=1 Tax=Stenotrophomonas terrae TaxID=405446 RepID=UPI000AB0B2CD|nr:hypothetical protein [Stenotrophomonas terrae]